MLFIKNFQKFREYFFFDTLDARRRGSVRATSAQLNPHSPSVSSLGLTSPVEIYFSEETDTRSLNPDNSRLKTSLIALCGLG